MRFTTVSNTNSRGCSLSQPPARARAWNGRNRLMNPVCLATPVPLVPQGSHYHGFTGNETAGKKVKMRIIIMALTAVIPLSARTRKMFPANQGSVALENSYADRAGIARFEDAAQVAFAVDNGWLVSIPITSSPKLPQWRRYVRPATAEFMLELDGRFNIATGRYLTVNSAVRPQDVQRRLAKRNRNAAPATGERASSHERGTTFDISKRMKKSHYRWLLIHLAYYQAIGRIHVIEERACLHIMVREDNDVPRIPFVSPSDTLDNSD